jgi:hypothetical protein
MLSFQIRRLYNHYQNLLDRDLIEFKLGSVTDAVVLDLFIGDIYSA